MAKYRILSIDGGGIRGVIPVVLLQRLSQRPALTGFLDKVDLLAGTSTGGLISLSMAKGLPLDVIRDLYETKGERIFDDSWLDDVFDLGKLTGADYSIKGLRKELRRVFGETRLSQLNKRVVITAFDLDNEAADPKKRRWKPKIFHNFPGADSDGGQLARDVGLYTSAAPTYFPSVNGYVDGGVYASNPSMCALAQAQNRKWSQRPALDEVVLFSMGTGTSLEYIKKKNVDWGYAQWAKPLVQLMLDGVAGIADYQCAQLLGEGGYHRLAPDFPPKKSIPMDAWRRVPEMIELAGNVSLSKTVRWLKQNWV